MNHSMTPPVKTKQYEIAKQEVFAAWKRVKANQGVAGVDGESIDKFGENLSGNLYKLWNRMSSGSYLPKAVKRVEILKADGSKRLLGIPTVYDRVAQEVVRARLEVVLKPLFHEDSYGYRPGKSGIDAVRTCRKRNWRYDWVLDVDIQKFFDTINHDLLLKAVRKHCPEKWMVLYIERWLKAAVQHQDGRLEESTVGTPQGGVISPLLANLYLHYAFDKWMERERPSVKFERYADDIVCHCRSEAEARTLLEALEQRLAACGLKLHPEKTKIVYCKRSRLKGDYPNVSYTFLSYTFQPRASRDRKTGKRDINFLPAASMKAQKRLLEKLREKNLKRMLPMRIDEVASKLNPILRGWFNYFGQFYRSKLSRLSLQIDRYITKWVQGKYRYSVRKATKWLQRLKTREPKLFAHWGWFYS